MCNQPWLVLAGEIANSLCLISQKVVEHTPALQTYTSTAHHLPYNEPVENRLSASMSDLWLFISFCLPLVHARSAHFARCFVIPSQRFQALSEDLSFRDGVHLLCSGPHGGGLLTLGCSLRLLQTCKQGRRQVGSNDNSCSHINTSRYTEEVKPLEAL